MEVMSAYCLGFLCTRCISCVSPYDVKFMQVVVLSTGFDLSVESIVSDLTILICFYRL